MASSDNSCVETGHDEWSYEDESVSTIQDDTGPPIPIQVLAAAENCGNFTSLSSLGIGARALPGVLR